MTVWQSNLEVRIRPGQGIQGSHRVEVRAFNDDTARSVLLYVSAQLPGGITVRGIRIKAHNFERIRVIDVTPSNPEAGPYVVRAEASSLDPSGSWDAASEAHDILFADISLPAHAGTVLSAQAINAVPSNDMSRARVSVKL